MDSGVLSVVAGRQLCRPTCLGRMCVTPFFCLVCVQVSQHAARTGLLQFEDEQLVVAAPELALMKPRRMFLYKNVPAAPMQSLEETIGPGSLEIDPGREGAGVGGGSDEQGQCFADVTCGPSCAKCEKCQCLMDDGRYPPPPQQPARSCVVLADLFSLLSTFITTPHLCVAALQPVATGRLIASSENAAACGSAIARALTIAAWTVVSTTRRSCAVKSTVEQASAM